MTRGWEMMLSHELETGITTGFCKGTPSASLEEAISLLKTCVSDLGHPLLLPLFMLGSDSKWKAERQQRDAREWLRKMEHVIAMRDDTETESAFIAHGVLDIDAINRDLVECHAQVLWKRPSAYISVIDAMQLAAALFIKKLPKKRDAPGIERFQQLVELRLGFYKRKWEGMELYANTTLQRLEVQRNAVSPAAICLKRMLLMLLMESLSATALQHHCPEGEQVEPQDGRRPDSASKHK